MMEQQVMRRVVEHARGVENLGHEFFFVSAYGSWNYDLGCEDSDVDTVAALFPKFNDFVLNKRAASTTHILPNTEHVELKDVRFMFEHFWKQNMTSLEVLFSKYCVVNPDYQEEWEVLQELKEQIAHYNNWYAVNCMYGLAAGRYANLDKRGPSQVEMVEKYGYAGKQLQHLMKMVNFISAYSSGCSFEECLTSFSVYTKETLMAAKRQEFSCDKAYSLAETCMVQMESFKNEYLLLNPRKVDDKVKEKVDDLLYNLLKRSFLKQLEG